MLTGSMNGAPLRKTQSASVINYLSIFPSVKISVVAKTKINILRESTRMTGKKHKNFPHFVGPN